MEQDAAESAAERSAAPVSAAEPAVNESEQDPFALASAAYEAAGTSAPPVEDAPESPPELPGERAAPQISASPTSPPETPPEGTEDELARLRAENEQLRTQQPAPSPPKSVGDLRRFVGMDPIHEGGPTLEQLERLASTRDYRGLNELRRPDGSYGYSLEEALDVAQELKARQQLIQNTSGLFHDMAWTAIGGSFDAAAREVGLDPAELAKEAAAGGNPLAVSGHYLEKIRDAAFKAGRDAGVKDWKGRHDTLKAEYEAYKAEAAGSAQGLVSGGRGQGSRGGIAAVLADADRDPEGFVERAIRGDYAGIDLGSP